ncbi:hypothetical protein [Lacticaseibacillus saniviri]
MTNPMMTLREFDAYMKEAKLTYSLWTISQLEEAATYIQRAKMADADEAHQLYGQAYLTQVTALESAEIERDNGQLVEPVLRFMLQKDEHFIHQIYDKWRRYLDHIGAHIQEVKFND